MNRREHLLTIASEECAEIAQRLSKAIRFGVDEIEPGQNLDNTQRINQELSDLFGVIEMLFEDGLPLFVDHDLADAKKRKVEKFLAYSAECGTLTGEPLESGKSETLATETSDRPAHR